MAYTYNPIKLTEYCIIATGLPNYKFDKISDRHEAVHKLEQEALNYADNELKTNIEKYENIWLGDDFTLDKLTDKNFLKEMIIRRKKLQHKLAIKWVRNKYKI